MHVFGVQEYPERSHVGTRRTDTSKISSSEFFSPVPTSLSQIVLGILSKSYMFREVANQGKRKYLSGFFPGFFCDLLDRGHKWICWVSGGYLDVIKMSNKTSINLSQHSKVTKANIQTDDNLLLIFIHMDSGWLDVLCLFWSLWHKRFLLFPHS